MHVERQGQGEPIIFLHGAGGSSQFWYHQREPLGQFMDVLAFDLPGHGQSPGEGCATIEEARDAVYQEIRRLNLEKCYLAGHSMGGAIAMSLALAYPDLLKGIVLICTGARLRVLPAILEGVMKDKESTVRMIMMDYAFSKAAPQTTKETGFKEMMKSSAEVIYRDFAACDRFNVLGSLGAIKVPALIICGGDDILTPPAYGEYLHGEIADSEITFVESAGHMVMIEKPEAVNQAIAGFVRRRSGGGGPRTG